MMTKEQKQRKHEYYIKNRERILKRNKKYYEDNKEKIDKGSKKYYEAHREEMIESVKENYQNNRETRLKYAKEYSQKNAVKVRIKDKKWFDDHPGKRAEYANKSRCIRKGWGEPIPINDYKEGYELHHLHANGDKQIAIYIPAKLHKSIYHSYKDQNTMDAINREVIKWINNGFK